MQQPQWNALGLKWPKRHEGTGYSLNKRANWKKRKKEEKMSQKRDKEKPGNLTEIEEKKNKTRKNWV